MRLLRRPGVSIAAGLIIIVAVIAAVRTRGPLVATAVATRTELEQHLVASGRVRVVTRVQLSTQIAGRVIAVHAVEAQRVKAGDLLVQIDDTEAKAAVSQAKAAVAQASARVEQLRQVGAIVATEASRQTATTLAQAEADLARLERLAVAGGVSRADLEEARRTVDIARAQKKAAEAQQSATTPRGAESSIARSALVESEARLAEATARLQFTRLNAPQDGVILRRAVEPGDTVQPGTPLVQIAAEVET